VNSIDPDGLFWGKLWRAIKKVLTSKWFLIAVTVALAVITIGAGLNLWALSITKGFSLSTGGLCTIGAAACLGGAWATTHATALGWVASSLKAAVAIGSISFSAKAILGNAIGFAAGIGSSQALSSLGGAVGSGGTPDWNPDENHFKTRRVVRGPILRRPWRQGLRHFGGVWRIGGGQGRPTPVGYSSSYPRDVRGGTYREAHFRSEGEARFEAMRKIGNNPVEIEQGKWRSFDGRWQYRANPIDLGSNHVHLERLNPATGQVLQNWHFRFPAGTSRK
jgi:hypothetical protein